MSALSAVELSAIKANAQRVRAQVHASMKARTPAERDSLPGRTWRGIALDVRIALVMLAVDQPGEPAAIARQPWESFSDADRLKLATTARLLRGELRDSACLW